MSDHDEGGRQGEARQDNVGYDNMKGGGEWPSPDSPPEAPAPGVDEARRRAIEAERGQGGPTAGGSATTPDLQQDASSGGDRGPARRQSPPQTFRDVLKDDPLASGSRTFPEGENPRDETRRADAEKGGGGVGQGG